MGILELNAVFNKQVENELFGYLDGADVSEHLT